MFCINLEVCSLLRFHQIFGVIVLDASSKSPPVQNPYSERDTKQPPKKELLCLSLVSHFFVSLWLFCVVVSWLQNDAKQTPTGLSSMVCSHRVITQWHSVFKSGQLAKQHVELYILNILLTVVDPVRPTCYRLHMLAGGKTKDNWRPICSLQISPTVNIIVVCSWSNGSNLSHTNKKGRNVVK